MLHYKLVWQNYEILSMPMSHKQLLAESYRMISIKLYPSSSKGKCTKVVHISKLQHRYFPGLQNTNTTARRDDEAESGIRNDWSSPEIEHVMAPQLMKMYQNHTTYKDTNNHQTDTDFDACGQAFSWRGKCNMIRFVTLIHLLYHAYSCIHS